MSGCPELGDVSTFCLAAAKFLSNIARGLRHAEKKPFGIIKKKSLSHDRFRRGSDRRSSRHLYPAMVAVTSHSGWFSLFSIAMDRVRAGLNYSIRVVL